MPVPPPVTRPTLPERSGEIECAWDAHDDLLWVERSLPVPSLYSPVSQSLFIGKTPFNPEVCSYVLELSLFSNVVSLNLLPIGISNNGSATGSPICVSCNSQDLSYTILMTHASTSINLPGRDSFSAFGFSEGQQIFSNGFLECSMHVKLPSSPSRTSKTTSSFRKANVRKITSGTSLDATPNHSYIRYWVTSALQIGSLSIIHSRLQRSMDFCDSDTGDDCGGPSQVSRIKGCAFHFS